MRELFRRDCINCIDVLIINNDMLITAAVAVPVVSALGGRAYSSKALEPG